MLAQLAFFMTLAVGVAIAFVAFWRMGVGRLLFGFIYLGAAFLNLVVAIGDPAAYVRFMDHALIPLYQNLWMSVVVPRLTLFLVLLIAFEVFVGLLILSKGTRVKVGLGLGTIFMFLLVPSNPLTIPLVILALTQAHLLTRDYKYSFVEALRGEVGEWEPEM